MCRHRQGGYHDYMTTSTNAPAAQPGRGLAWIGLGPARLGLLVYAAQLYSGRFPVPWYAPISATAGAVLLASSLARGWSRWRITGLVFVVLLAGVEWFFLVSLTRLPPYAGPVE